MIQSFNFQKKKYKKTRKKRILGKIFFDWVAKNFASLEEAFHQVVQLIKKRLRAKGRWMNVEL
jgi:hypothetical protein